MRQVRIGIDVGGTFTDAVAIDNSTYEIIAKEKIPTTHNSKEGVAEGIITVLQNILRKNGIAPEEVVFIAHGTTQATNALLEGDVATTGILSMGSGLEAARAKSVSDIGNIPLALGKELKTFFEFVETALSHQVTTPGQRDKHSAQERCRGHCCDGSLRRGRPDQ